MKDAAAQTAVDTARNMATGVAKEALKTASGDGRQGRDRNDDAQRAQDGRASAPTKKRPAVRGRVAMKLFPFGHATHPQWQMAAGLVLAQLRAQMALPDYASAPTLGLLYITDHYAPRAQDILDHLGAELPEITDWSGTVGVGIASSNVEYFDEPALARDAVRAAARPVPRVLRRRAAGASARAWASSRTRRWCMPTPRTPDVAELIAEMAARTATGYLFGGLASSRTEAVQFAVGGNGNIKGHGAAGGVFRGGLSGVAFGEGVLAGVARHAGLPAGGARSASSPRPRAT